MVQVICQSVFQRANNTRNLYQDLEETYNFDIRWIRLYICNKYFVIRTKIRLHT